MALLLALLLLTALTIRLTGQAAWTREQAAARAEGLPVTFAELVASAPVVDAKQQEYLWNWSRSVDYQERWQPDGDDAWDFTPLWNHPDAFDLAHVPAKRLADGPEMGGELAELSAILDAGPVHWGGFGWLRQNCPPPAMADAHGVMELRSASAVALHTAAQVYAQQALGGADPLALRHLDALLAALRMAAEPLEAEEYAQVAHYRDWCQLLLLARGRLPPERIQAWLSEPNEVVQITVRAFATQRVLVFVCADERASGSTMTSAKGSSRVYGLMPLVDHLFLQHEIAQWSRHWRAMALALHSGSALPSRSPSALFDYLPHHQAVNRMYHQFAAYDVEASAAVITAAHQHRLLRAAARVVLAWRDGALPTDQAAAEALKGVDLRAVPPLLPPLVYERLSPTRFRLGTASLPAGPGDLAPGTGQPVGLSPAVAFPKSLELDCAALVP